MTLPSSERRSSIGQTSGTTMFGRPPLHHPNNMMLRTTLIKSPTPSRPMTPNRQRFSRRCTFPKLQHDNEATVTRRRCASEPEVGQKSRMTSTRGAANARFPAAEAQQHYNLGSTNSIIHIAQRSTSSKAVKKVLADLQQSCDSQDPTSGCSSPEPEKECSMLAQHAVDAYYRVVIAKNKGISILCAALKAYPDNASIRASCCAALHLLAESHMDAVTEAGGVSLMEQALRKECSSQSAN